MKEAGLRVSEFMLTLYYVQKQFNSIWTYWFSTDRVCVHVTVYPLWQSDQSCPFRWYFWGIGGSDERWSKWVSSCHSVVSGNAMHFKPDHIQLSICSEREGFGKFPEATKCWDTMWDFLECFTRRCLPLQKHLARPGSNHLIHKCLSWFKNGMYQ